MHGMGPVRWGGCTGWGPVRVTLVVFSPQDSGLECQGPSLPFDLPELQGTTCIKGAADLTSPRGCEVTHRAPGTQLVLRK